MQGFCPPRELQGNSAEGRARVFRDQSNAMLALSPKREYRSVTPTFRFFRNNGRKRGIFALWCVSKSVLEKGHTGRLCGSQGGDLHPDFFRRQRKEQGNNAEVSVLFTAVFILHPRTPLQCCNLQLESTTSIWCRPCVKQYRQYFSWLRSRYGGRVVLLRLAELPRLFDCLRF